MAQVSLINVTKRYDGVDRPAVDGVSLEAHDGEFLVLVGPSGCGKTTTLRLVAGLEDATSGEIRIGERRVNDVAPAHRDIAMIFQNYALYPHMTVYQNMGFGLKMRRFPKAEIDRRVREAAESLGLTEYLNRKPKALSGGQRQRVAVGRAIVRDPSVFLFDEPLSNLDAKMRVAMRNEIRRLHRELGTTMIYVTHDQVEAMTMGTRIAVMNEGRVQQLDEPKTIYGEPANEFVAGFIGSPPMNLLRGRLVGEGDALAFQSGNLRLALTAPRRAKLAARAGSEVTLGLRPEDLSESPAGGAARIEATVESAEPLGHEVLLHLKAGSTPLTARLGAEATGAFGEARTLYVDPARAHFFDGRTGERLG
jgi:multiple sugar transport system ATP-binding protein